MTQVWQHAVGNWMAKRVCDEIVRCGLGKQISARYVSEANAVRVGTMMDDGAIENGIDYPADREHIDFIVSQLHVYALGRQQALRTAFHGRAEEKLAA